MTALLTKERIYLASSQKLRTGELRSFLIDVQDNLLNGSKTKVLHEIKKCSMYAKTEKKENPDYAAHALS